MIKILSCVMVFLSSYLLGYLKALDLEKRYLILTSYNTSIVFIENEMSLIRESVIDIIKKLANTDMEISTFYKIVLSEKEKNPHLAISDIFKTATENYFKIVPLLKEDKDLFYLLGKSFGKSDIEGEIKILNTLKTQLNTKTDKAKKDKEKNLKLYKSLGFYLGLLIIVMLY